ncbi:helix-turn-helix domain-containing protein [Alteromonas sp. CYL-A6]|uniref:helix-turn-helix domain-containing protein n=1 Tax=Alteromonas nitratireducens TaxID=3390813 RepID=UPI0034BCDD75
MDNSTSNALPLSSLSKRELQVAHKIMEGLPNKRIASHLFISERTVKFHCANIYRKLAIPNRAALMAAYFRSLYQPQSAA